MECMKLQWADIHHSRNQDWKALLAIIGVFSALFYLNGSAFDGKDTYWIQTFGAVGGVLACGVGGYMSFAHWRIFWSKLKVIRDCERSLDIHPDLLGNRPSVQGTIFFILYVCSHG